MDASNSVTTQTAPDVPGNGTRVLADGATARMPDVSSKRRARGPNWRKLLFRFHGWLGLNVGLILFVVCLSGTFATVSHEIDWLVDSRHRVPRQDAPADWTAMHEAIEAAFPGAINLGVYIPGNSGFLATTGGRSAAVSYVQTQDGETRKVYLNPYTGAVTGHSSFVNVQRFFRTFHRRLFDGTRGIVIVTLLSFALLFSAISGLVFYRGWLKQLFTLRLSSVRRIRWSDLHKTFGVWGLVFAIVIALTGVFYFVEVLYQEAGTYDRLLSPSLPQVEATTLDQLGPNPRLLDADVYVRNAEAAMPGLGVRAVRMTNNPADAVYVDGYVGNPLVRDRANKVHLDPFTGAVLGVQRSSDLAPVPFITDAVDPLHFGYFGGFWTKAIWVVFGLMLSFSVLSGTYLYVIRTATGRRARSHWLRGASVSLLVTLLYFGHVFAAAVGGIRDYGDVPATVTTIGSQTIGPWLVRMDCAAPCESAEPMRLMAHFEGSRVPNYASAELVASGGTVLPMRGPSRRPVAVVESSKSPVSFTLRVTTRGGAVHEGSFVTRPVAEVPLVRAWPDAPGGVWFVVIGFALLCVASMALWLWFIWKALANRRGAVTIADQHRRHLP